MIFIAILKKSHFRTPCGDKTVKYENVKILLSSYKFLFTLDRPCSSDILIQVPAQP